MADRSGFRAADADRERVAERLRRAAVEGRLLTHELEQRLERALSARTYGELEAVIADLPGPRVLERRRPRLRLGTAIALMLALPLGLALAAVALFAAIAVVLVHVVVGLVATWWIWVLAAWLLIWRPRRRRALALRAGSRCGWHAWSGPPSRSRRSRAFWA